MKLRKEMIAGLIIYFGMSLKGVSYANYESRNSTTGHDGINSRTLKSDDLSQSVRYWIIKKPQATNRKSKQKEIAKGEKRNQLLL